MHAVEALMPHSDLAAKDKEGLTARAHALRSGADATAELLSRVAESLRAQASLNSAVPTPTLARARKPGL